MRESVVGSLYQVLLRRGGGGDDVLELSVRFRAGGTTRDRLMVTLPAPAENICQHWRSAAATAVRPLIQSTDVLLSLFFHFQGLTINK